MFGSGGGGGVEPDGGSGFCADSTSGSFWRSVTAVETWSEKEVSGLSASCSTTCALYPPAEGACAFRTSRPSWDWVPGSEKSSE